MAWVSRLFVSFWIFGLLNNVLYVVILSAAVDLVGPLIPKATVLLADILPAFLIKLSAPFFIHLIPYSKRIVFLIVFSVTGMGLITFGELHLKLFGIVLASLSSGLGEITFLQLTHFYSKSSLNGWSSGTGGAGLIGSGVYLILTTILRVDVKTSLLIFSVFPFGFLYYFKLPEIPVYQAVETNEVNEINGLSDGINNDFKAVNLLSHFSTTLQRIKELLKPFLFPLLSVYFSEYLINQSVSPTLLFPLESLPFPKYRDVYVTYGTIYQLGVFISRSSGSIIKIRNLYILSVLQFVNLIVLILQSLYFFIPNVYIIFLIIFYEGLLGGASYVNTFMKIIETVDENEREFVLGTTSMGDSFGISIAALVGIWLEPTLCKYQVSHGRDWCRAI